MRGDGRDGRVTISLLAVLATTFSPATSDCDSVFLPEERPPPPLPQSSQSCLGPFPVLLKVSLGEKFAGLEHVVRTEPSSLVVSRCSGACTAGYHSVCRGTNTTIRYVHRSSHLTSPHLTSPHLTSHLTPHLTPHTSHLTPHTSHLLHFDPL